MAPPLPNPEPELLRTPNGSLVEAIRTKAKALYEKPKMPNRSDSVDFQRVKLSARDWVIATVGFTAYALSTFAWIESRMGAVEREMSARGVTLREHDRRIDSNATIVAGLLDKQSSKLDELSKAVNSLAVSVAELAAKNSNPLTTPRR